jgi:hypothetical protein
MTAAGCLLTQAIKFSRVLIHWLCVVSIYFYMSFSFARPLSLALSVKFLSMMFMIANRKVCHRRWRRAENIREAGYTKQKDVLY